MADPSHKKELAVYESMVDGQRKSGLSSVSSASVKTPLSRRHHWPVPHTSRPLNRANLPHPSHVVFQSVLTIRFCTGVFFKFNKIQFVLNYCVPICGICLFCVCVCVCVQNQEMRMSLYFFVWALLIPFDLLVFFCTTRQKCDFVRSVGGGE